VAQRRPQPEDADTSAVNARIAEPAAPSARHDTQEDLAIFWQQIREVDAGGRLIVSAAASGDDVLLVVSNAWHDQPKHARQRTAESLWRGWATIHTPQNLDKSYLSLRDGGGNAVGGSRIVAGSLIWIQD
jgi:hypothetical protein